MAVKFACTIKSSIPEASVVVDTGGDSPFIGSRGRGIGRLLFLGKIRRCQVSQLAKSGCRLYSPSRQPYTATGLFKADYRMRDDDDVGFM